MGNSKSNTVRAKNPNLPIKPIIKKPPVPGTVYGYYNQYPGGYIPEQYYYPYPENYPVVSSEQYLRNEFYPTAGTKTKAVGERIPTHHHHAHQSEHTNHRSHHHHHSPSHHSHHHHHRPSRTLSPPPVIKEHVPPSTLNDSSTSAIPPLQHISSVSAQTRVPTVVTYKIRSPVANEQQLSPTPPLRRAPTVVKQKPLSSVLIEKPTSIAVSQYSSSPILLKSTSPAPSTASNSFEKAPMMALHYVAKSSDDNSIPTYGPGTMTIVKRTASQSVAAGNRWYDHDFDKRVKPLVVENV